MSDNNTGDKESDGVECPTCNSNFDTERGMKIHHSQSHGESLAGVAVECTWCGSTFRKKESWANRVDNHFCPGEDCESEWRSEKFSGEGGPAWKGGNVELSCEYCGDTIHRKPSRIERSENHFCNEKCHYTWLDEVCDRSGENSARWNGGLVTVECAVCGDTKDVKAHVAEDYEVHYCGDECKATWMSENFSGDQNPRWKGGANAYHGVKATISDRLWDKIAGEVRERDGYECQMCGRTPEDKLDVHHIVPLLSGGTNDPELLISLCRSCHNTAEGYCSGLPGFEMVLTE